MRGLPFWLVLMFWLWTVLVRIDQWISNAVRWVGRKLFWWVKK